MKDARAVPGYQDMSEINAIKIEVAQAIGRRMKSDGRSPADTFGVASTALSESLGDMIFAAAKSEEHGKQILQTCLAVIKSRWDQLAHQQKADK